MTDEQFETQLKLIQQVLEELKREGRVKRTDEYRNGRPVYTLRECGKGVMDYEDLMVDADGC